MKAYIGPSGKKLKRSTRPSRYCVRYLTTCSPRIGASGNAYALGRASERIAACAAATRATGTR